MQENYRGLGNAGKDPLRHLDLDLTNVGSATEQTGLIPALPRSYDERVAYNELYGFEASIHDYDEDDAYFTCYDYGYVDEYDEG